jgi:vitamin B12 transporter
VRLAQGVDDSHTYFNGAPNYRYRTQNNQFSWQNNLKIAEGQQLILATEYLGQAVESDTLYTQTTRNEKSVLGGYTGVYGAQQVQLNLRQDNYSDFGTANTGLLGYGLSFADNWRATVTVSNAFKAPTFNDMYYPFYSYTAYGFTSTYQGNPNLKPERSQNKEIGLHYEANGQHVDVVYFDNRISDLIAFNATYTTVVNINQAKINGEELSYAGDFGSSHFKANLTLKDPIRRVWCCSAEPKSLPVLPQTMISMR